MNAPLALRVRRDDEHRLQKAVVQHLMLGSAPGVYWCAIPNGGSRSRRTAGRLKAEGVRAGAPDLLIIVKGYAIGLELKTAIGRQSPEQRAAEQEWERAGGCYFVARTIDEALSILGRYGVLRDGYRPPGQARAA